MATTNKQHQRISPHLERQMKSLGLYGLVSMGASLLALLFLMPFAYGGITSFKDKEQITRSAKGSILPMDPILFEYAQVYELDGEQLPVYNVQPTEGITRTVQQWALVSGDPESGKSTFVDTRSSSRFYDVEDGVASIRDQPTNVQITPLVSQLDIYEVPMEDGSIRELAALTKRQTSTTFIDTADPYGEKIEWEGRYLTLDQKMEFAPRMGNFKEAWNRAKFLKLFRNTLAIAVLGMIGTLLSSILVAYAFSRFPIPGKNLIFLVLIGTIILPNQVRLIPTYAFFSRIHWTGTWLPLIVPHFFANAYNVFLLRQYFLTLPREMDEAAMIDGAGPFTILLRIIIPLSWPVIVAVALFHFVFAWNDYFEPLIYLLGKPNLHPISVGIQQFNFIYDQEPHLIQATSLLALVLPVFIFFISQRFFMQGVVVTGVDK